MDTINITQKMFDVKNLEKYKSNKEFDYTEQTEKPEPTFLERVLNWLGRQFLRFLEWLFGVKYAKGILATILTALPYVVAGLVLFLLIKFFIKTKIKSAVSLTNNKSVINFSEDEKLLQNADLDALIKKSISDNDYRLAVRFLYLKTLKQLTDKKLVVWEQQKTNEDYTNEISVKQLKNAFENITRLYDFVWYGDFKINKVQFNSINNDFETTHNLINAQKNG
ncbi:MAG: DUF4129 domain-containing protein [Lutibacter sp.]|uniref:DUF4129 domain-containing protein n=1 Tax=Lutibacter sp. TaxID=1925666 RepID=UPI00299DFCD6|nr:DUF4129 domain-containing protein [Lutibacter sp.]MDX1828330.1 DUF4129 domain-containing protein [Lutibacter sp.]